MILGIKKLKLIVSIHVKMYVLRATFSMFISLITILKVNVMITQTKTKQSYLFFYQCQKVKKAIST